MKSNKFMKVSWFTVAVFNNIQQILAGLQWARVIEETKIVTGCLPRASLDSWKLASHFQFLLLQAHLGFS